MNDESNNRKIFLNQVILLYNASETGVYATIINSVIMLALFYKTETSFLYGWFILNLIITTFRLYSIVKFKSKDYDEINTHYWYRIFFIGLITTGLLWGIFGYILFPKLSTPYQSFMILLFGGMVAGSIGAYSSVKYLIDFFSGAILFPVVYRLFSHTSSIDSGLGLLINVFWILMVSTSKKMYTMIKKSIELQFKNSEVLEKLSQEKIQTEALNDDLAYQVKKSIEAFRALEESEKQRRFLINNISDVIWKADLSMKYTFVTSGIKKQQGYNSNDVIGKPMFENIFEKSREKIISELENIISGKKLVPCKLEYEIVKANGELICIENSIDLEYSDKKIIGLFGIIRDISERKKQEKEREMLNNKFQYTQKLESLGVLAGGIAHDFNNILVGIMGNVEILLSRKDVNQEIRELINKIKLSSKRASGLTNQMLAYSGKGKFDISNISLNSIINEIIVIVEASISKKIKIKLDLAPDLPDITGDSAQINQVIMNLIINAADSIGDNHGQIRIKTGLLFLNERYIKKFISFAELKEGHYEYFEVEDTGCGMDKETLSKIFEPFFTTKFTGRGLGLSAVLGIILGHHGAYRIYSEPGKGTCFRCLFPPTKDSKDLTIKNKHEVFLKLNDGDTVLIVDDEQIILEVIEELLSEMGLNAISAENGEKALEILKTHKDIIKLIFLDITMPVMNGFETFNKIHKIKELPILFMSGYSEEKVSDKFKNNNLVGFIHKPFDFDTIKSMIKVSNNEHKN